MPVAKPASEIIAIRRSAMRAKQAQGLHPLQTPQSMRGIPQQRGCHKTYPPAVAALGTDFHDIHVFHFVVFLSTSKV